MARTHSAMTPLGSKIPEFSLPDPRKSESISEQELKGKQGSLVVFICNHCPFVIHILDELVACLNEYQQKGISVVAISSNDVENFPDDSPEKMAALSQKKQMAFPYLYDESQSVAKAFGATCTPDFFLYSAQGQLVYRGQFDSSRPGNNEAITGADLRAAMDTLLSGDLPEEKNQKASIGCNIKWKQASL